MRWVAIAFLVVIAPAVWATTTFDYSWNLLIGTSIGSDPNGYDNGCAQINYDSSCYGFGKIKCPDTQGDNFAQTGKVYIYIPTGSGDNVDFAIKVGSLTDRKNNLPEGAWVEFNFDFGATPPAGAAVTLTFSDLPTTGYVKVDELLSSSFDESFNNLTNVGASPSSFGQIKALYW